MPFDDMVGEKTQSLLITARGKELERANTHVTFGNTRQHRTGKKLLACHLFTCRDHSKRPRRRYAQCCHRLAYYVLTQDRTKYSATVPHTSRSM